jgi:hypothetical protein
MWQLSGPAKSRRTNTRAPVQHIYHGNVKQQQQQQQQQQKTTK